MIPFIDIAVNLCDEMYRGVYHGKSRHVPDVHRVLRRCEKAGLRYLLLTTTVFPGDFEANLRLIQSYQEKKGDGSKMMMMMMDIATTIGIHPTQAGALVKNNGESLETDSALLEQMASQLESPVVHAVGEFGLDYERLQFASKEVQVQAFQDQCRVFLPIAHRLGKPLFLHGRGEGAIPDVLRIITQTTTSKGIKAVMHSFDGSLEDARLVLDAGYFIGINGW